MTETVIDTFMTPNPEYTTLLEDQFAPSEWQKHRRAATTPSVSASHTDQWVDWGDHTVAVEPMGTKQWIHDSHDGHFRSEERGRHFDRKQVNELLNWERTHEPKPVEYYTPIIREGRFMPSMKDQSWGCRTWKNTHTTVRRDISRDGELPAIMANIRANKYQDKDRGQIEAEMREQERNMGSRLFADNNHMPRQTPGDVTFRTKITHPVASPGTWGEMYPGLKIYTPIQAPSTAYPDDEDWRLSAAERHFKISSGVVS